MFGRYNTVTSHWIDEEKGEHCSHTLACSKFKKRHFAECYEEEIRKVAAEYDLMLPEKAMDLENLSSDEDLTDENEKKKSKKRKYSNAFPDSTSSRNDLERSSKRSKPEIVQGCAGKTYQNLELKISISNSN